MKTLYRKNILFVYSLFIFVISVLPVREPKELEYLYTDKIVHFSIYFVLVLLFSYAFFRIRHLYVKSFIYAFSLGLFIEVLQYFIPYRSFDILDIAANCLGAVMGLLITYRLEKRVRFN